MKVLSEEFVEQMNTFGSLGIPFLFIIDYEMNSPVILRLEEAQGQGILFDVNGVSNSDCKDPEEDDLLFVKSPISYSRYSTAFGSVLDAIRLGNTFLLNLTFPTEIQINRCLRQIFEQSSAPYRLLFKDQFVVFSPECFIQIEDGKISAFPMKGTIDASLENAADIILADEKEKAEHATIVDLIRNDLSMVADSVEVLKYRFLQRIKTNDKVLIQVSSEISGKLRDNYLSDLGTIISRLLPAGSICGAPKPSTLEIIRSAERQPRGFYTGVFGIFDGHKLDSAVMIRFIEKTEGKYYYRSGGGITVYSDPEKEYNELIDKVYVTTH